MAKRYSDEFKLKIVNEYLEGFLGYKRLAKKYSIPSTTPIKNWINAYKIMGEKGVRNKRSRSVYSLQFKLDVLHFKKRTGSTNRETANAFNLNHPALIAQWNAIFLEKGIEGLKGKGCAPMSQNKNSKSIQGKSTNREKQLEHENELLRLEVAYLKKLKAFQENPDAYLEKHKQRWHTNSNKKDSN
ncbi:MAG: transposase [Staphylococcus equorum]|nr:transposase [Staphylococcus equorum]